MIVEQKNLRHDWESKESDRYYTAFLHRDLFETWIVTCTWGGKRGRQGSRVVPTPVPDYETGLRMLGQIAKRREQRGYAMLQQSH